MVFTVPNALEHTKSFDTYYSNSSQRAFPYHLPCMASRSKKLRVKGCSWCNTKSHLKPIFPLAPSVLWATGFLKSLSFDPSFLLLKALPMQSESVWFHIDVPWAIGWIPRVVKCPQFSLDLRVKGLPIIKADGFIAKCGGWTLYVGGWNLYTWIVHYCTPSLCW